MRRDNLCNSMSFEIAVWRIANLNCVRCRVNWKYEKLNSCTGHCQVRLHLQFISVEKVKLMEIYLSVTSRARVVESLTKLELTTQEKYGGQCMKCERYIYFHDTYYRPTLLSALLFSYIGVPIYPGFITAYDYYPLVEPKLLSVRALCSCK